MAFSAWCSHLAMNDAGSQASISQVSISQASTATWSTAAGVARSRSAEASHQDVKIAGHAATYLQGH